MKILQVALGKQEDIREALCLLGEVIYWDWTGRHNTFNRDITNIFNEHNPDVVWLQIQTPGIINIETAKYLASKSFVINWTGDVRSPLPTWYKEIGKQIQLSLFTNMNDVLEMRQLGINSDYLQIGFPEKIFTPSGPAQKCPEIIFMANMTNGFPLSDYRRETINFLRKNYANRFAVYGSGWGNGVQYIGDQNKEAEYYRGCKIAINLSHFNYSRYSSDRIFRLMGAGAFCLSHKYIHIEKEFEIGKHLDVWDRFGQLQEKIDYYLNNDEERIKIAKEGCNHVHRSHTWNNRIVELKQMLKLAYNE